MRCQSRRYPGSLLSPNVWIPVTTLRALVLLLWLLVAAWPEPGHAATHLYLWGDTSGGATNVPAAATNLVAVAAGDHHIVAVRTDGQVLAWGGQILNATKVPADATNAVSVTAGSTHCLALLEDGTTRFWGNIFTTGVTSAPPVVQQDILALGLGPGAQHIVALRPDGAPVECGNSGHNLTNVPAGATNLFAVAAASYASVAVRADGTVVTWGDNLPPPRNATNVAAVATGFYHALVLRTNGTLVAWGDNSYGQLNIPSQATNIVAIACGGYHCLALRGDGKLFAWGQNIYGQSTVPAGLSNIVGIACLSWGSIALTADDAPPLAGRVLVNPGLDGLMTRLTVHAISTTPLSYQWMFDGTNLSGATAATLTLSHVQPDQAGLYSVIISNAFGAVTNTGPALTVAAVLIAAAPQSQTALVGGKASMNVVALGEAPLMYQWQFNGVGLEITNSTLSLTNLQLSDSGTYSVSVSNNAGICVSPDARLTVLPMELATPVRDLSSFPGGSVTLGVGVAAYIPLSYQWQFNGIDLDGATSSTLVLTNLQYSQAGLYSVIVSNQYNSLTNSATLNVSQIALWGGVAVQRYNLVPWGLSNVVAIAGADNHRLALQADGTVVEWGSTQFGMGTPPADLTNAIAITAGSYHSLALRSDGSIAAWGGNFDHQIEVPPGLQNVAAVAAGNFHSLALLANGTVLVWGDNRYGQTNLPAALTNVVAISGGEWHSLALRADGTVVAWGAGTSNTGTDPNFGQSMVPPGLTNVIAIAAGGAHSLALKADGSIVGWGGNFDGQITIPQGLSQVVALGAGYAHSLALSADGAVTAWGYNYYGQSTVPAGLSNVIAISGCGLDSSMALMGGRLPLTTAVATNPTLGPDGFTAWIPTQNGRVYALEYSASLSEPNWTLLPLVPGIGTPLPLTDPTPAGPQRFYRVRSW